MSITVACVLATAGVGIACCIVGAVCSAVFYRTGYDDGYDAAVKAMADELGKGVAR